MATLHTHKINDHLYKDDWQYQVGAEGEMIAVDAFMHHLPKEFQVFTQLKIPNKRSRTGNTKIDIVIVGPTGIFCIEVKRVSGIINITRDDKNWVVNSHITGRKS